MDDAAFVRAFLDGSLPTSGFHHRDHLRLAWVLVRQQGLPRAHVTLARGISQYAAAHGHARLYHETVTRFWVDLVRYLLQGRPDLVDFDAFLTAFPHLLDKGLPARHWRQETLESGAARAGWVEPDRLALPW